MSTVCVAAETLVLPDCQILLKDEVKVPAQEPGVLVKMPVKLGQQVRVGEMLAQIDDTIPQAQVAVSQAKLVAAQAEAESNVTIEFATASRNRAEGELRQNEVANRAHPGTVVDVKLDELRLKVIEAELSIKKAMKDKKVAGCQADVADAELKAAETNRDHRRITSTLDGVVVNIFAHVGEWLQSGEPVMYVVRMDELWVSGLVDVTKHRQAEIADRDVTVVVELARGQRIKLPGRIVFVSPLVESEGKFLVRAELKNQQENGIWVVSPGLRAEMIVHLD